MLIPSWPNRLFLTSDEGKYIDCDAGMFKPDLVLTRATSFGGTKCGRKVEIKLVHNGYIKEVWGREDRVDEGGHALSSISDTTTFIRKKWPSSNWKGQGSKGRPQTSEFQAESVRVELPFTTGRFMHTSPFTLLDKGFIVICMLNGEPFGNTFTEDGFRSPL